MFYDCSSDFIELSNIVISLIKRNKPPEIGESSPLKIL